ncbi:hypothetical protein DFH06DRAFT_1209585 [Mycena polygramma]|nr:hypothetical protein DFH06DRAFT_1209585 [Mycena polygramma]
MRLDKLLTDSCISSRGPETSSSPIVELSTEEDFRDSADVLGTRWQTGLKTCFFLGAMSSLRFSPAASLFLVATFAGAYAQRHDTQSVVATARATDFGCGVQHFIHLMELRVRVRMYAVFHGKLRGTRPGAVATGFGGLRRQWTMSLIPRASRLNPVPVRGSRIRRSSDRGHPHGTSYDAHHLPELLHPSVSLPVFLPLPLFSREFFSPPSAQPAVFPSVSHARCRGAFGIVRRRPRHRRRASPRFNMV